MTSYHKGIRSEITKSFHASTAVFRMKIVMKELLNKLQENIRRHQEIRKAAKITRPTVNE
jgi:hypothetical protein